MEKNYHEPCKEDDQIVLPPGFRFHPTDEELITHYLSPKVLDNCFSAIAIGEVDLNKCEPWDLPWRAKMGEKQWYFFCVRDRKYPTGLRTNRATDAGYWKATGKDKEIYNKMRTLVGMKKTLVFYKGRAPKGEKTNWVMHEYRLEGKFSMYNLPQTAQNEWVISRVFQKISGGKKIHISGLVRMSPYGDELGSSQLPPLMDSSPYNGNNGANIRDMSHVACFSNPMVNQKTQEDMNDSFRNPLLTSSASTNHSDASHDSYHFQKISPPNSFYGSQIVPSIGNLQYSDSALIQEQSILRLLLENQELNMNMKMIPKTEFSQETGVSTDMNTDMISDVSNHDMGQRCFGDHGAPCTSSGPVDIDCFWNY